MASKVRYAVSRMDDALQVSIDQKVSNATLVHSSVLHLPQELCLWSVPLAEAPHQTARVKRSKEQANLAHMLQNMRRGYQVGSTQSPPERVHKPQGLQGPSWPPDQCPAIAHLILENRFHGSFSHPIRWWNVVGLTDSCHVDHLVGCVMWDIPCGPDGWTDHR